ncbi:MAG: aminomethyl-transferring glycine dehydrogenase [Oligoflexales bacterium]
MTYRSFETRHIGPSSEEQSKMLQSLGINSLAELVTQTLPKSIQTDHQPQITALSEEESMAAIRDRASQNENFKNFIGQGYSGTETPAVIRRNLLENPGWYTQYTPYQAEIAQGRLEALMNFQTVITELTGLPIANASLLDEGTATAEAVFLAQRAKKKSKGRTFLSDKLHPQNIAVTQGRCDGADIACDVDNFHNFQAEKYDSIVIQYPDTEGSIEDLHLLIEQAKNHDCFVILVADILALTLIKSPAELGADIAVGNTQRFGVPYGFGGPHAAYFATKEAHKRLIPGRIVGLSKDREGKPARRLALQTREQHIRREKATSNICTAQALLANIAGMYAVWHGPKGLKNIALRIHSYAKFLADQLEHHHIPCQHTQFFDTVYIPYKNTAVLQTIAEQHGFNFRYFEKAVSISVDETTTFEDLCQILNIFNIKTTQTPPEPQNVDIKHQRSSAFLTQHVFHKHQSETAMMRYLKHLENKDISLTHSMIPLGSCTMKLNPAAALTPITWPELCNIHPYAPRSQTKGWLQLIQELENDLAAITGFDAMSIQPNSGAQGEYTGLLMIKAWQQSQGQHQRNICLIPKSAHGTNPASAMMAGFKVIPIQCEDNGNIDLKHLQSLCVKYHDSLGALMITYPSTHGVFEEHITEVCELIHQHGGQVYLDGANMNAQVGLCFPGHYGADVCHLNLHKTFSIPHGGGGPGVGPVGVKKHLQPFLPTTEITPNNQAIAPITSAPFGSAGVLPISWSYIRMMGADGLKKASQISILSANYMANRLKKHYDLLFTGKNNRVAHECILDMRPFQKTANIQVTDIAKRLMDYGFHAPTVSFPVAGTMMVEPTESENLEEIDRFCDAMIQIRKEIKEIEEGRAAKDDNVLVNAPHTLHSLVQDWKHSYSRETAVFPTESTKTHKVWPSCARIDEAYGDRNLICSCDDSILHEDS